MYFLLRQIPVVRLLFPFVIGIIAGIYFQATIDESFLIAVITICIVTVIITHRFIQSYSLRWISGATMLGSFFVVGFFLSLNGKIKNKHDYYEDVATDNSLLIVKIIEQPKEKERSFKSVAEIKAVITNNQTKPASGKIQLYFSKNDSLNIRYGDWLLINNKTLRNIEPPKNPHEFDYSQFMSFKQIHQQAFIRKTDFRFLKNDAENELMERIVKLNRYFSNLLKENVSNPQSLAIASSLLLGNREYLDFELVKAYSSSGAMHVLAVSGLHVGILFLMIDKLLFFLDKKKRYGRLIKSLLTVMIIWIYAMLTGFSPSVQRAAIMFSLISVGQNVQRSYNIYNVLAGAAIIQLCLNPFTIMEVGFQLSYAAVLGIVMFQKFFYDLIFIKYKWLDYFWQITCVSISAQLITFPIGLLYFHQFPIYFFVSNLVVIPAALGIMLTGITMFILSPVPYTSFVLGKILNFGILLMNKAVFVVEQIPYSLIQGLTISILEAWIIYVLVFLFFLVIHYKHPKIIIVSLVCVLFLTGINTIENYRQLNQKQLVFYNTPKSTYAYDFISGKENLLLASKSLTKDYSQMQFHIMHNWWEQDVRKNNIAEYSNEFQFQKGKNFYKQGNFIQFYNQKIMLINGSLPQVDVEQKLKVDYIILNNNPEVKLKNIAKLYDYKLIIADGSNSAKNNRRWKQEAEKDEINFRSVNENGAFVLNL